MPSMPPTPSGKATLHHAHLHKSSTTWSMASFGGDKLASLNKMQRVEDNKPRLSKISWLADVLVYRSSIIPSVLKPVFTVTLFAAAVATSSIVFDCSLGLNNNVVPLLSVVVGLLLVFRNSTAYERYAEGRKDFTALLSNARNLTRKIWINITPPPDSHLTDAQRRNLTKRKKQLIRMIVGFVTATKHHLRAEGGVEHADLKGLLPNSLVEFVRQDGTEEDSTSVFGDSTVGSSPRSYSSVDDEEQNVGVNPPNPPAVPCAGPFANSAPPPSALWIMNRPKPVRRPTIVRARPNLEKIKPTSSASTLTERTPLIKTGVRLDSRTPHSEAHTLGRMVEVGLPLVIAHEIGRQLFRFRRQGNLEAIGPAGYNGMQGLLQSMIEQLGSMERIIQTPLPYIFSVHLKQSVTLYLLVLPFVLVDTLGWKMIFVVMCTAFTLFGVEAIATQVEEPFGLDPSDLNLDLFCTELLCECEAIIERLPEGDLEEEGLFIRSAKQIKEDEEDGE